MQCVDESLRWRDDYFDEELHPYRGWTHFELTGPPATEEKIERLWRLGQVVTAIAGAGLVVRQLEEYPRPARGGACPPRFRANSRFSRKSRSRVSSRAPGNKPNMGVVVGLFLIAFGAILTWAVDAKVNGLDITAVGVILLVLGIVVVLLDLFWWRTWTWSAAGPPWRRTTYVHDTAAPVQTVQPVEPVQPVQPVQPARGRRVVVDEEVGAPARAAASLTESSSRGRSFPTVPLWRNC